MADETLEVLFIGTDKVTGVVKSITGSIQSNLKKAALGGLALGAGAAAIGLGAVKMASDFDAAMRNVNSIAQLPEQQFVNLRDRVLDFSLQTRASAQDVAGALYNVVSAGFDTEEGFNVMEAASRAAGAGLADTESTSKLLIATLRSYALPVSEADRVTDIFLQTVNQGITTLPELASGLGRIMPVASSLGVSLEELGFTVGQMTQSGLSTDEAMTRLQATFTQFLNPTTNLQDAIEELGYASGYELVQSSGGALGAIRKLKDEGFLDTTEEAANLFSNVRALGGVMAIMADDATLAEGAVEAFGEKAEGAVERAREQQYKSLSANIAKLKSAFEAIAIKVGTAVIPVFLKIVEVLVPIAREIGSNLAPVLERVSEIATIVGYAFEGFIENLQAGMSPIEALKNLLSNLLINVFGSGVDNALAFQEAFDVVVGKIEEFKDRVLELIDPIIQWISEFVQLKDVLIAVGVVIASVLIPIVISLITTLLPIIATVGAVVLAVAFLRNVWENDFLGIRTALENFWNNVGKPVFEAVRAWLQVHVPAAIAVLKSFWENVLLPAIQRVWAWIKDNLIPFFRDVVIFYVKVAIPAAIEVLKAFWENVLLPAIQRVWNWLSTVLIPFFANVVFPWLQEKIPAAIQTLRNFWENVLLPAIQAVWGFIQDNLVPLFQALWELLQVAGGIAIQILKGLWQNILLPAIKAVWAFIQDKVIPIFQSLWEKLQGPLSAALETVKALFDRVGGAIGRISGAIQKVIGWIRDLTNKLRNITLPDWLVGHSPSPFENTLTGIAQGLRQVGREARALDNELAFGTIGTFGIQALTSPNAVVPATSTFPLTDTVSKIVNYNITIQGVEGIEDIPQMELLLALGVDV